jgi:Flp pilus assembly protein TadG
MTRRPQHRPGAVAVEAAVVYGVMFTLLLGLIVGGMGVFRYQQTAALAREAARYAAVHGTERQKETDQPPPTQQEIRQRAVEPMAVNLDLTQLGVRVEWVDAFSGQPVDWDSSGKATTSQNATGDVVSNRVRVTVTYQWTPEWFLGGPLTLKSVAEMPMSF